MSQRGSEASAAARRETDVVVANETTSGGLHSIRDASAEGRAGAASALPPDVVVPGASARSETDRLEEHVARMEATVDSLSSRLAAMERRGVVMRFVIVLLMLAGGFLVFDEVFPEGVIVQKTLMESKELKLVDSDGNPRLFLRMYSRVPVLQVLDGNGKPRMSLGLRFDDTPFIDLDDQRGRTRATLEITENDTPALRLFDEKGDVKFQIN